MRFFDLITTVLLQLELPNLMLRCWSFKCANIYEFQAKINMDRSRVNTEELWT
jgi:hypothetical protein